MTLLRRANIKAIPTGIDHGTVTAVVDAMQFEITTLRMDVENYGRRAKVAFIDDWSADAARRDFTFNALSCTPDGDIYDYFGGLEDLVMDGALRRQRTRADRRGRASAAQVLPLLCLLRPTATR